MGLNMAGQQPGRNDLCPCGSKLKFKYCHGDESKRVIANRVANLKMMELVKAEQKKRGILLWDWKCNNCGHGFDVPSQSTVSELSICPKCGTTDVEQNSNGGEDENHGTEES